MGDTGGLLKLAKLLGDEFKLHKTLRKDVISLNEELAGVNSALPNAEDAPANQHNMQTMKRDLTDDIEKVVKEFLAHHGSRDETAPACIAMYGLTMGTAKACSQLGTSIKGFRVRAKKLAGLIAAPRHTLAADDLVGLEHRVKELTDQILAVEGSTPRQPMIASITGLAGVGKTALAKAVYDNLALERDFTRAAWVAVSNEVDIKKVIWRILCQISPQDEANYGSISVDKAIAEIQRVLKDHRYLVVIDDIRTRQAWDTIRPALFENSKGSTVLITSCEEIFVPDDSVVMCKLVPFETDLSRKLFCTNIFGSEEDCPSEFKELSGNIVEKCSGIRLEIIKAARSLGSRPLRDWRAFLDHSDDSQDSHDRRMIECLSNTYQRPYLKSCLLYLSMFKKGSEISVDHLVWGWIAEGFICEQDGMTLRQVGELYLIELINRSFVEAVEVGACGKTLSCRVANKIHDSIVSLSAEENFVTLVNGREGHMPEKVHRRLSIQGESQLNQGPPQGRLSHVRSLFVCDDAYLLFEETGDGNFMQSISKFENLRVLDLEGRDSLQNDQLKGIGSLFLLRYLVVGGNCVTDIPKEIGNLAFLQILDLRATSVKELPDTVARARELKCLYVNGRTTIPDWIGSLQNLEELGDINISKPELLEKICSLTKLMVLGIAIWSWDERYDYASQLLEHLGSLFMRQKTIQSLSILTSCSLQFLEKLDVEKTPVGLQKLEIRHSTFDKLPEWISSLEYLSCLSIEVYNLSQDIVVMLGKLQNLLVLSLTVKCTPDSHNHKESLANFGVDGFRGLTSFHFVINAMGKIFEQGALPSLNRLKLSFDASRTKEVFGVFDFGLENLPSLEHLNVQLICFNASNEVVKAAEAAISMSKDSVANFDIQKVHEPEQDILENGKEDQEDTKDKGQKGMKMARRKVRVGKKKGGKNPRKYNVSGTFTLRGL